MAQTIKGTFKAKHGPKSTLPTFEQGIFGVTDDTDEVFVGSASNGNIQLAKQTDLDSVKASVSQKISSVNGVKPGSDGSIIIATDVGSADWSAISNKPTFSTVATSGSYNDLTNKPVIPPAFTLPIATTSILGGVKQGAGVSIDANGVLNASVSGGSTSVPMTFIDSSELSTLAVGTFAFCTDTLELWFGTPNGNAKIGTVTVTPPTDTGGGTPATPVIVVSDDFNRVDSTTTPGTTDSYNGGTNKAWTVDGGTLGIIGNQLYAPTTTGSRAHIDAGISDAKMEVTVATVGTEHDFYFRTSPTNAANYLRYAHSLANGGTWYLQEQTGTFTTITSFPGVLANGDKVSISAVGSTVTLSLNDTVIHTANTLTDLQTNTGWGIGFSGSTAGRVDNFSITDLSGTAIGAGDTTAPVLTITPAGSFTGTKTITMTTDDPSATIFYTTNGTVPTYTGTTPTGTTLKYTAAFSISASTTVKACAVDTAGNTSAVQTVIYTLNSGSVTARPTNFVLVTDYGAVGNTVLDANGLFVSGTNDTTAIQNAVNAAAAAGKAVIVNVSAGGGQYLIDSNNGINLPSNTTIYFDQGAAFIEKAGTTNSVPKVINALNASNINIIGYPKIIGDRLYHTTPAGEYGMGLYIRSCTNVYIENYVGNNCWGDGIYLGDGGGAQTWCENVTIKNCNLNNNRRQGISVISVKGLTLTSPVITNTNGTDPQCGIDFEPNTTSQFLQGILVTDPFIQNNAQHGIHVWIGFGPGSNAIDITVTNAVNVKNNLKGNYYVGGSSSVTKGYIKIDGTYYLNK